MELNSLHALSVPSLAHDALVLVGIGTALMAGFAFITLGLLLPGLLTALGGKYGDANGRYLEFGPAAGPLISEPAPPRAASPETDVEPRPVARPHLWGSSPGVRSHI
jgi:hypothetical protein